MPKKIGVQKNLGQKKCWSKNIWIIILVQKHFMSKKFWFQNNFGCKKYSGPKKFQDQEKFKVKQNCWVQKNICPKELLTLEKYFGSEKDFSPKYFCVWKKMGPKKFLGFKELFRLYEACVLNIDLLLYPEPFKKFAVVVVGVESDFSFLLLAKP